MKKIPYGESNFKNVILDNGLYIDKTRFIETLEHNYKFTLLLRPRRFGKSLFISTLQYYYDEAYKTIWSQLFDPLYIGQNPTPLKSSYKVLFFEFSGIVTETEKTTYRGFKNKVKTVLLGFLDSYGFSRNKQERLAALESPEDLMSTFFEVVKEHKLYILIDEYDHFANAILADDIQSFKTIIGKGGYIRSFYETIKAATQKGIVERLFITGVTPIMLDSMTSGFNIAENISNDQVFNNIAGFTLQETQKVLSVLQDNCPALRQQSAQQKLIQDITSFYNGYQFSVKASDKLFNANLLMYFVKKYNADECQYPVKILDSNIASDYTKIMQLFHLGDKENNYQILNELVSHGEVTATLKDKFDFSIINNEGFDRDEFITLLFAMGFITIKQQVINQIKFVIPNYIIKHLYFNYFQKEIENRNKLQFNSRAIEESLFDLATHHDIKKFKQEIQTIINTLSNRDLQNFNEKHMQTLILTVLNISDFYFIKSEMEFNKKYPDIMLLRRNPFDVKYQYLFELKFCKKKDNDWPVKKQQGIKQVKSYQMLDDIKHLNNLKCYVIISDGDKLDMFLVE